MSAPVEELDRPTERKKLAEALNNALFSIEDLPTRIAAIENSIDGRILFSTSLGIEDQVLLHAIAKARSRIEAFTLDTGRHFPETYDILSRSERVFGTRIRVVFPDAGDVEDLVARDGIFGFRYSVDQRKACCNARKVLPLQRALENAAGWVTGVRREQSTTRGETPFAAFDGQQNLIKINPIADWTLERVEAYVAEHNVPVNALHAHGFPSIGCQPCTRAIEPGEDIRAGRWWWEDENRKECGLHNRPGGSRNL
ncbi:phosphoadenylyl-sulfate reductase [Rhodomicrobium sp.]|jgi:phosphoadenosine phosphosulfate reductase|uniref:phosphoadenylyl-sulfate reductase n=1 Tax=Rhodomicrobium sp. TaxID=2720632 RepID=UPI0039E5E14D